MPIFSLVKAHAGCVRPKWLLDVGACWTNRYCNAVTKDEYQIVLKRVEADDFESLDHTLDKVVRPFFAAGWLGPDAEFYGCPAASRERVGKAIAEHIVEPKRVPLCWLWVPGDGSMVYYRIDPPRPQRKWLWARGIIPHWASHGSGLYVPLKPVDPVAAR